MIRFIIAYKEYQLQMLTKEEFEKEYGNKFDTNKTEPYLYPLIVK